MLDEGPDLPVELDDNGALHLRQEFEIPDGTLAVRMQTGDLPVTIIGWIGSSEQLPDLLESVAKEIREMLGSDASAPTD
jgi:hypothetical protein